MDNRLVAWRLRFSNGGSEIMPGRWVCSFKCYKIVASAMDNGLAFIYCDDDGAA